MKHLKQILWVCILFIIIFFYAHIDKKEMIYDKKIDSSEYVSLGVVGGTVTQEFVCKEETLDGVSVKCQVVGESDNMSIEMELLDTTTGKVVASASKKMSEVENGKFNTFSFGKIGDCKGKSYQAMFTNKGEELSVGFGVGFVKTEPTERNTRLSVDGTEMEGTMILKTVTKRFDFETFCVLWVLTVFIIVFFKRLCKLFSR